MTATLSWEDVDQLRLRRVARYLSTWPVVSLASGSLAGMAAFLLVRTEFAPVGPTPTGLAVAFAGGMAPVFVPSLRESIRTAITGYLVGAIAFAVAWMGPWLLLPFSPGAIELLLLRELGLVLGHVVFTLFMLYFLGYLTVITIVGLVDPTA